MTTLVAPFTARRLALLEFNEVHVPNEAQSMLGAEFVGQQFSVQTLIEQTESW